MRVRHIYLTSFSAPISNAWVWTNQNLREVTLSSVPTNQKVALSWLLFFDQSDKSSGLFCTFVHTFALCEDRCALQGSSSWTKPVTEQKETIRWESLYLSCSCLHGMTPFCWCLYRVEIVVARFSSLLLVMVGAYQKIAAPTMVMWTASTPLLSLVWIKTGQCRHMARDAQGSWR